MRQHKLISTTAVVLSVAIICIGGNVYAREEEDGCKDNRCSKATKYQQRQTSGDQSGILGMNGRVSPTPTRDYRQTGVIEMNGVVSPAPTRNYRQSGVVGMN